MPPSVNKKIENNYLPYWFKQKIPNQDNIKRIKSLLKSYNLNTVCENAVCPNIGQCWEKQKATFMILGDICTRSCRFCGVKNGTPLEVDNDEPKRVANIIVELNLQYVVLTSVTRDDLEDGGSKHFARAIREIKFLNSKVKVEVLIPDFLNNFDNIKNVVNAHPEVISHNIETVRRISHQIRPQADYERSLNVLRNIKKIDPFTLTKSGIMLGLGETKNDVIESMIDLVGVGCDILTIGQYLSPSKNKRNIKVDRYVNPSEFDFYKESALQLGFKSVLSGPLVRSSYKAQEIYKDCFKGIYN